MLKPASDRLDYGKILAPPEGYTLGSAVGTSYSLDFDALVGTCLSLGLSADMDSALLNNPVYLLKNLHNTGERVILFCQAGQIQVPKNPSALYILLEKIVNQIQVKKQKTMPQSPSFHPKFWLLKYEKNNGDVTNDSDALYRVIVLSRNLTFDRSWDVSVCLDGRKQSDPVEKNKPLSDFLEYLRESIAGTDENAKNKRKQLRQLLSEIDYVHFNTDGRDFSDFEFIPVGIPNQNGGHYTMDEAPLFLSTFNELLVISPFLSGRVIDEFNTRNKRIENPRCILITRREALQHLKPEYCDKFDIYTMKDIVVDGENAFSDDNEQYRKQDIHAKVYLWRRGADSELYLGSLNASHSALNGNVEFVLRLVSRYHRLNMEKLTKEIFNGAPDNPENPFEIVSLPEPSEPEDDVLSLLERQIKELCRLAPSAHVEEWQEKYRITLQFEKLSVKGDFLISPLLSSKTAPITPLVVIDGLTLLQLSEFYCVTARDGENQVRRLIKIATANIPKDRDKAVVKDVIKDPQHFFQYVAFLLGDDYLISALEDSETVVSGLAGNKNNAGLPALYERMLRTAANAPEKFKELDYILQMVDSDEVIPRDFAELYHSFKKAVGLHD